MKAASVQGAAAFDCVAPRVWRMRDGKADHFTAADIEVWIAAFLYPFLRILALMSSAPLFSHESVPVMVRIGLAFGITLVVGAALPAAPFVSPF